MENTTVFLKLWVKKCRLNWSYFLISWRNSNSNKRKKSKKEEAKAKADAILQVKLLQNQELL
jgi:hypothetical protein